VVLSRIAAGSLQLLSAGNPATLTLTSPTGYNAYVSLQPAAGSVGEIFLYDGVASPIWSLLKSTTNLFRLRNVAAGTYPISVDPTTDAVTFSANVTVNSGLMLGNTLNWITDNAYDIASGGNRPRDIHLSRDIIAGGSVSAGLAVTASVMKITTGAGAGLFLKSDAVGNTSWAAGVSGYSGYSGISGFSGATGGTGGTGISGYSGSGVSGYSGISGWSGYSGISGYSGATPWTRTGGVISPTTAGDYITAGSGFSGIVNFIPDNTYSIGTSTTVGRPNNIYIGNQISCANILVTNTAGSLKVATSDAAGNLTWSPINKTLNWVVSSPVSGSIFGPKLPEGMTATKLSAYTDVGTVTFNVSQTATIGSAGSVITGTNQIACTTGSVVAPPSSAALTSGDWLLLNIYSVASSPTQLTVTLNCTAP
jgi:hypothetical protein